MEQNQQQERAPACSASLASPQPTTLSPEGLFASAGRLESLSLADTYVQGTPREGSNHPMDWNITTRRRPLVSSFREEVFFSSENRGDGYNSNSIEDASNHFSAPPNGENIATFPSTSSVQQNPPAAGGAYGGLDSASSVFSNDDSMMMGHGFHHLSSSTPAVGLNESDIHNVSADSSFNSQDGSSFIQNAFSTTVMSAMGATSSAPVLSESDDSRVISSGILPPPTLPPPAPMKEAPRSPWKRKRLDQPSLTASAGFMGMSGGSSSVSFGFDMMDSQRRQRCPCGNWVDGAVFATYLDSVGNGDSSNPCSPSMRGSSSFSPNAASAAMAACTTAARGTAGLNESQLSQNTTLQHSPARLSPRRPTMSPARSATATPESPRKSPIAPVRLFADEDDEQMSEAGNPAGDVVVRALVGTSSRRSTFDGVSSSPEVAPRSRPTTRRVTPRASSAAAHTSSGGDEIDEELHQALFRQPLPSGRSSLSSLSSSTTSTVAAAGCGGSSSSAMGVAATTSSVSGVSSLSQRHMLHRRHSDGIPNSNQFDSQYGARIAEENCLFRSPGKLNAEFLADRKTIGSGSYGRVLRVIRRLDMCVYALKFVEPRGSWRLPLREVHALAALADNPFVVRYFDCWVEDNILYILTELCRGTLAEHRMAVGPIPEPEVLEIASHLIMGLAGVHEINMAHLDIKPENVYLSQSGVYKIGDFGNASVAVGADSLRDAEDGTNRYLCTHFMQRTLQDLRQADIFSLGATLLELVLPHALPQSGAEYEALRNGSFSIPERVSPQLAEAIHSMMNPDPKARPTCSQLLENPLFNPMRRMGEMPRMCAGFLARASPQWDEHQREDREERLMLQSEVSQLRSCRVRDEAMNRELQSEIVALREQVLQLQNALKQQNQSTLTTQVVANHSLISSTSSTCSTSSEISTATVPRGDKSMIPDARIDYRSRSFPAPNLSS